jgi:hypothetical protein
VSTQNSKQKPRPALPTPEISEKQQNDQAAQIEWLAAQLQDAHLVIGQQQMALLRAEQAVVRLQQQLTELQAAESQR